MTVEFQNTKSVRKVTFTDQNVKGSVEVAEYDDAPKSVRTDIAKRYATDSDSTDSNNAPSVVAVADISPTSDTARQSPATIEISVPREELRSPDNAAILHQQSDGSWARLSTDFQETTDETVTLQATVQSFSLFAVVDESAVTPTPIQVATPTPTPAPNTATPGTGTATTTPTPKSVVTPNGTPSPSETPTPGASGPGFTISLTLLVLLVGGYALRHK